MAPDAPVGLLVLVALLGILTAAALSAGEAALDRLTRTAAAEMVVAGRRGGPAVARLAENPARAMSAATFARALAEATAAVCIALAVAGSLSSWWQVLLAAVVASALILAVVVGASPRTLGRRRPTTVLGVLAPAMLVLSTLGGPLERLRLWKRSGRTEGEREEDAAEELRDMVDRVSEAERIEDDEREMLQSVFELGLTRTREVMVPRTSMVTLPASTPAAKALRLFVRSGFSRVPVVADSVDDVVGVLYLKDVLHRVQTRPGTRILPIQEIARSAFFVPETKPVDDLMRELQQNSVHMAIVVDEYGGIAGLVTIEDCLEEIVGELRDEHDHSEPEVEDLGGGLVRVPARLPVDELGDLFGVELHDDEVDSAGGLLAKALGKVPIPGATASVQGLELQAERAEGRRRQVSTLLVHRVAPPASTENGSAAGPAGAGNGADAEEPRETAARRGKGNGSASAEHPENTGGRA